MKMKEMKKYRIEKRTISKPHNPMHADLRSPKYKERVVHPKRYEKPPKVSIRNYDTEDYSIKST